MADRIKGITIEIGGDTTGLKKSLSGVNSEIRNTQLQLKDVERLLKLDPSNTELLKQKQKLLSEAVEETKTKLEALKEAEKQVQTQFSQGKVSQEQYDGLKREIAATEQQLKTLEEQARKSNSVLEQISEAGRKMEEFGSKVTDVGKKIMPVSAAVGGIGVAAIKTTADFDESMSKVLAISGASADEFEELRIKAREMGEETKFSASEAADAFTYMAMAGWDASQMLDGIEGIMSLAAADGLDLATTSDIVTDALTAFGYKAADAGHFADVLAMASSAANTNVSMLGESFKYVAPVAGALKYSAEDTAVALGLMANSGIKASQAGTQLRGALTNMVKPTKAMDKVMSVLKISLTDSDGKMKTLSQTMDNLRSSFKAVSKEQKEQNYATIEASVRASEWAGELEGLNDVEKERYLQYVAGKDAVDGMTEAEQNLYAETLLGIKLKKKEKLTSEQFYTLCSTIGRQAIEGLTEAEQAKYATTLFGKEAMSGMLAIINASEADYNKLTDAIANADGTSKKMANTMQDNLNGQLTILKSQLQEAAISIGDTLVPSVRDLTSKIQELVDWFNGLSDSQKELVVKIGLIVAAAGPLLIVLGQVSVGVGGLIQMTSQVGALLAAMGAAGGPLFLVIAGLGILTGALIAAGEETVNYYEKAAELTETEQANKESVDDLLESYGELTKQRQDSVSSIDSQAQKENELWRELQNITDENGKVKAGYEERAAFITSTLSSALGTEITMTDGVIQNYKDMQVEIDGLIEKKRSEAILNAYQAEYTEAVNNTKRAQDELSAATANAKTASDNYNSALAQQKALQEEYNLLMSEYEKDGTNDLLRQQLYDLSDQMIITGETVNGLKVHMDENNQTLENARLAVENYNTTIANYEGAAAAILSGDQAAISYSLMLLQNDFKTTQTSTAESLRAQYETIRTELANAKTAFAEGTPGITAEYLAGLESMELESRRQLQQLSIDASAATGDVATAVSSKRGEMETAGSDFAGGLASGIRNGTVEVTQASSDVAQAGVDAARTTLDSHSPSKVTEGIGGDFDTGLAIGISGGVQEVTSAVKTVTDAAIRELKTNLQASETELTTFQNTTKINWTAWAGELVSSIQQSLNSVNTETSTKLSQTQTLFNTHVQNIKSDWEKQFDEIARSHGESMDDVKQKTSESMQEMSEETKTKTEQIKTDAVQAYTDMVTGIETALDPMTEKVKSGFSGSVSYIEGLETEASSWGDHIMSNLINAIDDRIGDLRSTCRKVANTISDYLEHTTPKKGPLKDDDIWMEHMMDNFSSGIEREIPSVVGQMQRLAGSMNEKFNVSMANLGAQKQKPTVIRSFNQVVLDGKVIAETVNEELGVIL